MSLKDIMMKVRRAVLCCGGDEKHSLEISSPTDVRRGVLEMPGLTNEERDFIREKASADATRLLSLTSHPPTRPSSTDNSQPPSLSSSREPSATLLNSASSNLPTTLPTPPRQKHSDSNFPVNLPNSAHSRMKEFWERTRRVSTSLSTHSHSGYQGLGKDSNERAGDGVVMLNLDFNDLKDLELESPVSGKSMVEGFEVQDVVGGGEATPSTSAGKTHQNKVVAKAIHDTEGVESSESEDDAEGNAGMVLERQPLVAA